MSTLLCLYYYVCMTNVVKLDSLSYVLRSISVHWIMCMITNICTYISMLNHILLLFFSNVFRSFLWPKHVAEG